MSLFIFFISLLIVAQHVSGNHVPIIHTELRCTVNHTSDFKEVFVMRMSRPYNRKAYRKNFFDWQMDWLHETKNTQHRIYFCHVQHLLIRERSFFWDAVMGLPRSQSMWKAGFSSWSKPDL